MLMVFNVIWHYGYEILMVCSILQSSQYYNCCNLCLIPSVRLNLLGSVPWLYRAQIFCLWYWFNLAKSNFLDGPMFDEIWKTEWGSIILLWRLVKGIRDYQNSFCWPFAAVSLWGTGKKPGKIPPDSFGFLPSTYPRLTTRTEAEWLLHLQDTMAVGVVSERYCFHFVFMNSILSLFISASLDYFFISTQPAFLQ